MKLLLEKWRRYLTEGEKDFFPWLSELSSLDSPTSSDIEKAFPDWSIVGRGAYRVAYQPRGEKNYIIKTIREGAKKYASVKELQLQNKAEFSIGTEFPMVFPRAYSHHPDYNWIVVERVEVLPSTRSTGVLESLKKSFPRLVNYINEVYYGGMSSSQNTTDTLEYILRAATRGTDEEVYFDERLEKVFEFGMKYSQVFRELHKAIHKYGIEIEDIRGGNIGRTPDGRFVILDASVFD